MSSHRGVVVLLMHMRNRDELKTQIQVIQAEAKSDLKTLQLRLDQEVTQATAQQAHFKLELETSQHHVEQLTIERDDLLSKIEQLNHVNCE